MAAEYIFNGYTAPSPTKWVPIDRPVTTKYSGSKSLDTHLHSTTVRIKQIVSVEFGMMPAEQMAALRKATEGSIVTVRYPAPNEQGYEEKEFVIGDRTRPLMKIKKGVTYWSGYSFTMEEV